MQVRHSIQSISMNPIYLLLVLHFLSANADDGTAQKNVKTIKTSTTESSSGCICGVFLSKQFKKGSKEPPIGNPAIIHDVPGKLPCTSAGNRLCTNKCLDIMIKHLPNSSRILCSSIEHDCYKERAYLFINNCKSGWVNTNLSTGRQYCCKGGEPYKCPL